MSLLMDALKKAEQEKKEAAKRLKQTGPNPIADTGEHKIQTQVNLDNTGSHDMTISQEMDLSLEPLEAGQQPDPNQKDFTDELPVLENTTEMQVSEDDLANSGDDSGEMSVENTQEMSTELPSIMERGNGLTYDNSMEEDVDQEQYHNPFEDSDYAFDETLDSVTATQLVADIGGGTEQPTPVAAHTVFEATRSNKIASGGRWMLLGICAGIVMVAAGVLIHFQTTPIARDIPKPMALPNEIQAQQAALAALPKPELPPEPVLTEPVPSSGELTSSESEESAEILVVAEQALSADTSSESLESLDASESIEVAETSATGSEITDQTTDTEAMEAEETEVVQMTEPAPVHEAEEMVMDAEVAVEDFQPIIPAAPINPETIKISRSKSRPDYSGNLQQAYSAYKSGDLSRAESLYKTTLGQSPENRDALLGMAAIRLLQENKAAAFLIYKKLLQLNPKDKVARLALLRMQRQADPISNESAIKGMLAERPDSHHLYFSLGTLYASQQKWAEAQKAFFEAFALDNRNPDYALNLAISLDYMGQMSAAKDFYQRAVDLADQVPASFSATEVLTRIKAISDNHSS